MAERRPPGFNVDLGFSDSKEVDSIPPRLRLAAVGAWTLCGCWSASKRTDGYVPPATLKRLGVTSKVVDALVASTLWEPAEDGGIRFTRWAKWQRTKDEIDAFNQSEAKRKKAARDAAKEAASSDDIEASGRTSDGRSHDVRPDVADPELRVSSSLLGLSRELSAVGSGDSPPPPISFPDHCSKHRRNPEPPSCNDCRRTREQNHAAADIAVANQVDRAQRDAQRRADCWHCDPNGLRYSDPDDADSPLIRCEHPDVP